MRVLFLGYGYSARFIADRLKSQVETFWATTRSEEKIAGLEAQGLWPVLFDGLAPSKGLSEALQRATHIVCSAGPDAAGDPFLRMHGKDQAAELVWVGYLSTIGVYGDHGGAWVDEAATPNPSSERSKRRLDAEYAWQSYARERGAGCMIARLSGIYGPGRSPIDRVRGGKTKRIIKEGQVFNRIHGEDIGRVLSEAALNGWSGIMNVTDDEPAPASTVLEYAASLLGVEPPPAVSFEDAGLSEMGRSFYSESKRASNALSKAQFGSYLHPSYREGLASLMP